MKYFFALIFTLSTFMSFAQKEKEERTIHKINGKEFYIHVVDSGNTLFAISRMYAIPREEITKANPRLTETLTIGDRLMIPLDKITRKDLDEAPEIDGNFLIHEVQKKNTLYSLAKEYNVEINDIIVQNPQVENGLKKGMKLKIPVAKIKSSTVEEEYVVPAAASPYRTHLVLPKETLYSLSKLYNVTTDSILEVNNGLVGGLKEGELINLPILKTYETVDLEIIEFDSLAVKPAYRVSLLLPFYLDLFELANSSGYTESKKLTEELIAKSKFGLEFYQGFKLAVEQIVAKGLNVELKVLDTGNDSSKVVSILKGNELEKSDLIVGPLFLDNFLMVADYAKRNKINITSPVKLSNKVLLGNSYVSKVATSDPVLTKFLSKYMHDSLRFQNMIMVYPDQFQERRKVELIKKNYSEFSQLEQDTSRISPIKEVFWNPKDLYGIKSKLKEDEINVIVAPSEDQAFVTRLLTSLNQMRQYEFKVIGLAAWENYENIELDYLHNLNVHLIVSEYLDLDDSSTVKFKKLYWDSYESVPDKFSIMGYDVGMYYLSSLMQNGTNLNLMLPHNPTMGLGRKFQFVKTGIESGYENHSTYIIRYKDFAKVRVF